MRIFLCYIFSFFMLAQVAFGIFGATARRLASSRIESAPTLRPGRVWEGWGMVPYPKKELKADLGAADVSFRQGADVTAA